eukprot:51460_1
MESITMYALLFLFTFTSVMEGSQNSLPSCKLESHEIPGPKRVPHVLQYGDHIVASFAGQANVGVGIIPQRVPNIMEMVRFDMQQSSKSLFVMYKKQMVNRFSLTPNSGSVLQNNLIGFRWIIAAQHIIQVYFPGFNSVNIALSDLKIPETVKFLLRTQGVNPVISAGPGCRGMGLVAVGQGEPNGRSIFMGIVIQGPPQRVQSASPKASPQASPKVSPHVSPRTVQCKLESREIPGSKAVNYVLKHGDQMMARFDGAPKVGVGIMPSGDSM